MKLAVAETGRSPSPEEPTTYRLYKRRWIGLVALVCLQTISDGRTHTDFLCALQVLLNIAAGMVLVWFGPIANDSRFISNPRTSRFTN